MVKKRKDGWSVQQSVPLDIEDFVAHSPLGGFFEWMGSPEAELCEEVTFAVWGRLRSVSVDAEGRNLLWEDGSTLGLGESVQRLHHEYQEYPLDLVESSLTSWLEMEYVPEDYSEEQIDDLDRLTAAWLEDYQRRRKPLG